ncbi:MAG: hypothetical protein JNG83_00925, partial [Opitutaceae bacterium]|nr:hypothetical protein [Opitutaceae bacterium]
MSLFRRLQLALGRRPRPIRSGRIFLAAGLAAAAATGDAGSTPPALPAAERAAWAASARAVLHGVVDRERSWTRIHAIEALIRLGEGEGLRARLEREQPEADQSDYRIGAWRSRALLATDAVERARWIARIESAYRDPASADRLDAIETLAKLGHRIEGETRVLAQRQAEALPAGDAVFPLWALAVAGDRPAFDRLVAALASDDASARGRAAYALRWLGPTEPAVLTALARAAEREPADSAAYPYVLGAACRLEADPAAAAAWRARLEAVQAGGPASASYEASQALLARASTADFPRLAPLLEHA